MNNTEIELRNDFKEQISKISTLVSNNNFGNTSIDGIFIGKYWSTVQEMIEFIEDNYNVKNTVNSNNLNNNIQSSSSSSYNFNNKAFLKELHRQFPKESKEETFKRRASDWYKQNGIFPWNNKPVFLQYCSGLDIRKINQPIRDFVKTYHNSYWNDFEKAKKDALKNNQITETIYDQAKFCNVYIQKYWLNNTKFTIPDKVKKNFIPWNKI